MIPGMNPRQMKAMMRSLGMNQEEIEASEVIIKTGGKCLVFKNPSVQKISMQGQTTFQLSGDFEEIEEEVEVEISKDDVKVVVEQTGVSEGEARRVLEENNGDIAEAIVSLSEK